METLTQDTRLSLEWNTQKNERVFSSYSNFSHFKAHWICFQCKHEWQATIANRRGRGSNCPNCAKTRKRSTSNPAWTGHGEISGSHWSCIKAEASKGKKKLPFEITIEYAWNLFLKQNRRCMLSGKPLTMTETASLDRIDTTKGFIDGNVQWIQKKLQVVKRNLTDKEFIRLCEEVAMYQTEKKVASVLPPSFTKWTASSQ